MEQWYADVTESLTPAIAAVVVGFAVALILPAWIGRARRVRGLALVRCLVLPACLLALVAIDMDGFPARNAVLLGCAFVWLAGLMWCAIGATGKPRARRMADRLRESRATRFSA